MEHVAQTWGARFIVRRGGGDAGTFFFLLFAKTTRVPREKRIFRGSGKKKKNRWLRLRNSKLPVLFVISMGHKS